MFHSRAFFRNLTAKIRQGLEILLKKYPFYITTLKTDLNFSKLLNPGLQSILINTQFMSGGKSKNSLLYSEMTSCHFTGKVSGNVKFTKTWLL